jgi:hypothetical protein
MGQVWANLMPSHFSIRLTAMATYDPRSRELASVSEVRAGGFLGPGQERPAEPTGGFRTLRKS